MKGTVAWLLNNNSAGNHAFIYKGSTTFENLPSSLSVHMTGYVYNVTDEFITDSRFVEGAGKRYPAGTNVIVANLGTASDPELKYDAEGSMIDFTEVYAEIDKVLADIADPFSTSESYEYGEVVTYERGLYKFKAAKASGAWDSTKVDGITVDELLSDGIKSAYQLVEDTVGWTGKNFIGWKIGYAYSSTDGSMVTNANCMISELIPVSQGDKFIGSKKVALSNTNDKMMFRTYNSNKELITTIPVLSNTELSNTVTIGSGVAYIGVLQFHYGANISKEWADTNEIMFRRADIIDSTYEPYHASVEEYCASKELLENTVGWISDEQAKLYNWTGDSQGITYTYTKEQVTLNGTATANTSQPSSGAVPEDGKYTLKAGTYKIVCDVNNVYWEVLSLNPVVIITQDSKSFTITEDKTVFIRANIKSGASFNNKVVHVSLRKLSVEEKKCDNSVIGNAETAASSTHAYSAGQGFICDGQFRVAKGSGIAVGEQITDSNSDVKPIAELIVPLNDTLTSSNGTIEASRIYTCGKLVSYMIRFKATEDIPAGTNIINGIKLTAVVNSGMVTALFTDISTGDTYRVNLDVSANIPRLKTLDAIPNGTTIRGSITYISQ